MIRHVGVDFTGQFDKTSLKVVFLGLPGKVKGINGNAVSAQSGSRIKGLKAERFGGGSADDLPDIYAHAQAEHLELVHQRDIHAAIDVLQQLGHLCGGGRRNLDCAIEDCFVEECGQFTGILFQPTHDLGDITPGHALIAGIFTLRRKRGKEAVTLRRICACSLETAWVFLFQRGNHDFFRSAGIGGALQHYKLARAQMRSNGVSRSLDIAEIGLVVFV